MRALWIAHFVANIGTWAQLVGAQWLMGDLGGGGLAVALVQTAATLPVFLFVVPAGALGDMVVDRRTLLPRHGKQGQKQLIEATSHDRFSPHLGLWGSLGYPRRVGTIHITIPAVATTGFDGPWLPDTPGRCSKVTAAD